MHWLISETGYGQRFRRDLPRRTRQLLAGRAPRTSAEESRAVRRLWNACVAAAQQLRRQPKVGRRWIRHRDALLEACGVDTDDWVHPLLIRFLSAFLDQGLAYWPIPYREHGLYRCFLALYGGGHSRLRDRRWAELGALLRSETEQQRSPEESLERSLDLLGVPEEEREEFLIETALALRGWAGMVHQLERRPDRAPVHPPPVSLLEFLAVRLLAERVALVDVARSQLGYHGPLARLRSDLSHRVPRPPAAPATDLAWQLFHVAQIFALGPTQIRALRSEQLHALENELQEFNSVERRRVFHLAYERRLRHGFFDALAEYPPAPAPESPSFQAVFCLDEREESIRRHLEELTPDVETFGTAGFFGVAMQYRGIHDAHFAPLCPVAVRPTHRVEEVPVAAQKEEVHRSRKIWQAAARLRRGFSVGSRTLIRGTVLMTLLGALAVFPLVLRVLFPRVAARLFRFGPGRREELRTRLTIETESAGAEGQKLGFDPEEMVDIVARVLEETGLARRLAPLVLVIGHGSTSLNNPHESAHDCGACGGGRGGPNARAFAAMANHPRVREELRRRRGIHIPQATWFVGAEHNTCNDDITYFDTDLIPHPLRPRFEAAQSYLRRAARRNAHERCRRFDFWLGHYSSDAALAHVRARAVDLAQPRPEYGHATNAYCVVGRRQRTRGLFLDRRAFLVSYDPTTDADGTILARLLAAVVPVVAGINLEYYFGYVDPTGYGCGTKLPHNVTSLLGVMDGAQSDLRPGLPWQMVEISVSGLRSAPARAVPRPVVHCGNGGLCGRLIDRSARSGLRRSGRHRLRCGSGLFDSVPAS